MSVEGKVAIVTGATQGLGAAVARALTGGGMRVVGVGRNATAGAALEAEIAARGGELLFVQANIADPEACVRAASACMSRFRRIDVLINNAAIPGGPPYCKAEDISPDIWDDVIAVNLSGAFHLCRQVLPVMKRQKEGLVLSITSTNAVLAPALKAAYNASKAGLAHFTRSIAVEGVADGVRANNIVLGATYTEMTVAAALDAGRRGGSTRTEISDAGRAMLRRAVMDADEVAQTLLLLCQPAGRLITGSDIAIDQAQAAGAVYGQQYAGARAIVDL